MKHATRPELGHLGHRLPLLKAQRKRLQTHQQEQKGKTKTEGEATEETASTETTEKPDKQVRKLLKVLTCASMAAWASATKLAMSRPRTLTPTTARCWRFALDLARPFLRAMCTRSLRRTGIPRGSTTWIEAIFSGSFAPGLRQPNCAADAVYLPQRRADRGSSQRCDGVEHIGGLDAVAGKLIAPDIDSQHRQASGRRVLDVVRAGNVDKTRSTSSESFRSSFKSGP